MRLQTCRQKAGSLNTITNSVQEQVRGSGFEASGLCCADCCKSKTGMSAVQSAPFEVCGPTGNVASRKSMPEGDWGSSSILALQVGCRRFRFHLLPIVTCLKPSCLGPQLEPESYTVVRVWAQGLGLVRDSLNSPLSLGAGRRATGRNSELRFCQKKSPSLIPSTS